MAKTSDASQRPNAALSGTGLTDDAFLGGLVRVWQPANGFRAGLDSVMLAAAVPAAARQSVCELGLGVGVASLCLAARIPGLHLTGVELDRGVAEIAQANAARNHHAASFEVVVADVLKRPRALARQGFHHVITNPPFHDIERGTRAPAPDKAQATSVHARELVEWLRFARALVRPKGWVTAILPPEQLLLALQTLAPNGKGVEIFPLWPKAGVTAKRVIIRARMNSNAGLRLLPGLTLHNADATPSTEADAVLRHAHALTT
ncbi:MAG: methyltransferase [Alphaproteobacteria bacterium]|nr:methyltransferase [Alphaproteobacteria bacterium]